MKIDMHVHTSRYSHCASMSPDEMAKSAILNGLDGVAITEHDYLWPLDEINELQLKYPELKIFRGMEVSTSAGHILVYGLPDQEFIYTGMSLTELVKVVKKYNGLVVAAHPCRYSDEIPAEYFTSGLDGVETASLNILAYMRDAINQIRRKLSIPAIAGTDAHCTNDLGIFATDFPAGIDTERELINSVKTSSIKIYCDYQRIHAINSNTDEHINQVRRLIEQGIPASEIKIRHGFSYSFQYGASNSKDMRLLEP